MHFNISNTFLETQSVKGNITFPALEQSFSVLLPIFGTEFAVSPLRFVSLIHVSVDYPVSNKVIPGYIYTLLNCIVMYCIVMHCIIYDIIMYYIIM